MAVSAALGAWLGWQLDVRFATKPFGFVFGSGAGFAIGLLTLFRGLSLFKPAPSDGDAAPPAQDDPAPDDDRPSHPPQ
jgi:F0F1-type ATP synthase assembly protein I